MSEYARFFGGPVGSVPEYDQTDFAEVLKRIFSNGVFKNINNELEVTETDPQDLAVQISTGEGWIEGFWYQNTAELTKSLSAADGSNPRIDRIVLRLDTVTNFKISVEVLEGTPAGSPAAPSLTQTSSVYEIALAQVLVGAEVTSISNANITDERDYVQNQEGVMVFGDQTVEGVKTFSSIPVLPSSDPTSDNQAVRKSYVDNLGSIWGPL